MAQTPLTGSAPYLTAARVWVYRDERRVLQLLRDDDAPADKADAETATTTEGGRLLAALAGASGELEEYALAGGRYTPADLAALTGNQLARLEGLVADLAFWRLAKRRWPDCRPEDVSGAAEALAALERLGRGQTIFGTVESAAAGLTATADTDRTGTGTTVLESRRFFGNRATRTGTD